MESGFSMPSSGMTNEMQTALTLIVSWNTMNFRMLVKIVRPYKMARAIEWKLSSRITISLDSFATSVPPPIAKPTSARFSAGESFTPSPVMPTTRFFSCARRTRRLLSDGSARATTRRAGSFSFRSSSVSAPSSDDVSTRSESLVKSPASRAIAVAVSCRSPVIMTTCTPALCTAAIASMDSGRTSSRMPIAPTRVMPLSGSVPSPRSPSYVASASTRIARSASASSSALTICTCRGAFAPASS